MSRVVFLVWSHFARRNTGNWFKPLVEGTCTRRLRPTENWCSETFSPLHPYTHRTQRLVWVPWCALVWQPQPTRRNTGNWFKPLVEGTCTRRLRPTENWCSETVFPAALSSGKTVIPPLDYSAWLRPDWTQMVPACNSSHLPLQAWHCSSCSWS